MEEEAIPSTSFMGRNSFEINEENEEQIEDNDPKVIAIFARGTDGSKRADTFGRHRSKSYLATRNGQTFAKIVEPRRKVILLGKESARNIRDDPGDSEIARNRRIIELTDGKSKMALGRELEQEVTSREHSDGGSAKLETTIRYENMDLLPKVPPDTVVMKQCSRSYKDDSDYVRESTETSSGSSSATSGGYRPQKVKRIQRAIRNKNRSNAEIRRNPMRVTKRDVDKDYPRQRQRLLSANRKGNLVVQREARRRAKSTTMPYMNTRSVTRKMYTVGATYQAPTKRDETEWKEWPIHGMHERPVYHPQAGLAVEYIGKFFTSLDGTSYREIVDRSEVEIVSVDPRCDTPYFSDEKRQVGTQKCSKDDDFVESEEANESFASRMHDSLHSVLVYCSQAMSPNYKKNVDEKLKASKENETFASNNLAEKKENNIIQLSTVKVVETDKETCENRTEEMFNVTSNAGVKNTTRPIKPNILQSSCRKIFPEKSANLMHLKNTRVSQLELQEISRKPSKNLILLKTADPKIVGASGATDLKNESYKSAANDLDLNKLEEVAISDETLMELSSIYNNLVPGEENSLSKENLPKSTSKTYTRKQANRSLDFLPMRNLGTQKGIQNVVKSSSLDVKSATSAATSANVATWYTSDTSEIARILAEYNRDAIKKSGIRNYACRDATKIVEGSTMWIKNNVTENPRVNWAVNFDPKLRRGKWRRCRFALDTTKNSKVTGNASSSVNNFQSLTKNDESGTSTVISEQSTQGEPQDFKAQSLNELLENTSLLYCAATGVHQDDLVSYIDALDAQQSVQWLENRDG